MRIIDHHIVGHSGGGAGRTGDVFDPNTGKVQARVTLGTKADLDRAVAAAEAAQPAWAATNPQRRARVMFRFKELVEANMQSLAELLASEHGKVVADAKGDIQRGLEVVEFACGIPHVLKGEYTQGAGPGIDVYSMRQPLGIGAGITPFNFPAMIPLWMGAVATVCGNAFILKPSERDPSLPVRLAELFIEAGMPEGIFQVVHGDKEMVDAILDLVRSARPGEGNAALTDKLAWGPGPRASQSLTLAARARALVEGRLAPSVDDVAALAAPVLKHRVALTFAARADGETVEGVIGRLVERLG